MNWMKDVERRLASRPRRAPEKGNARRAAVLVPLFVREGMLWIVFTRRLMNELRMPSSGTVRKYAGAIAQWIRNE